MNGEYINMNPTNNTERRQKKQDNKYIITFILQKDK